MGQEKERAKCASFEKGWRGGREDLAKGDLLTRHPECKTRSFLAKLELEGALSNGDPVILHAQDGHLVVCRTNTRIAIAASPPRDVSDAIIASGGYANGVVGDVHTLSGTADIILK